MISKAAAVLTCLGLATIVVTSGCGAAPREEPTPTPIAQTTTSTSKLTYKIQPGTVVDKLEFIGRVSPIQQEQLYFKNDGRVAKVNVKEKDTVNKGDVLAELEISDLQNQLAQAQITLETAQSKLKTSTTNVADQRAQAESTLRIAQIKLAQARVKDPAPSVAVAAGNRDKAGVAVEAAQAAYDRKGGALNIGASAEAAALQRATIDYDIAKAQYELALQGQKSWEYDLQLLQEAVTQAESGLNKISATVDPALSQDVAKAQLAVDRLKAQADNSRIVSPIAGEIASLDIAAGRTTTAYKVVVVVSGPGEDEVTADLVSNQVQNLSVGQACTMTVTAYPGKVFDCSIRRIPSAFQSQATTDADRQTHIAIINAGVPLERGAIARVTVVLQQRDNALWVPPDALRTYQGKDYVLIQDGDAQRRVPVKVGIKTSDRIEIVEGLTAGQIAVGQ
jgi:multidrug efflux pump subunit AcrA (membrane-fusion protein)